MDVHKGKREEDYLEEIFLLSKNSENGVRITDIAANLNIKKSTVFSMVEKLAEKGYLIHERYKAVFITDKGINKAREVYYKHITILDFFTKILQVPEDIAKTDACNIEHYISNLSSERLLKFLEFLGQRFKPEDDFITQLDIYLKSNDKTNIRSNRYIDNIINFKKSEKISISIITGEKNLRNKLISDGIIPGTQFIIEDLNEIDITISSEKTGRILLNNNEVKCVFCELTQ